MKLLIVLIFLGEMGFEHSTDVSNESSFPSIHPPPQTNSEKIGHHFEVTFLTSEGLKELEAVEATEQNSTTKQLSHFSENSEDAQVTDVSKDKLHEDLDKSEERYRNNEQDYSRTNETSELPSQGNDLVSQMKRNQTSHQGQLPKNHSNVPTELNSQYPVPLTQPATSALEKTHSSLEKYPSTQDKSAAMTDGLDKESQSVEYRLIDFLLNDYNKHIKPVKEPGEVTYVFIEFSLFDVLKLDTKNQMLKTNTEVILKWMDSHLIWDPREFGNISIIRIPYYDIWIPDIILYNVAEPNYEAGILYTNAIIRSSGEVELTSHSIFSSICNVDIQWYPFDQQDCRLTFASWTYDHVGIQLILGPSDMSSFNENPEYFVENFYGELMETFNPCCTYSMSTVVYHIQMQRRTKFSLFFYLMPGILINLCAVMVFSLPAESGEKIGLGINSMLAMIVFLMAMTEKLPPTEKIPLAGLYYGICLSVITLNIAFSVFILNLNVAGDRRRKIPQWLKKFVILLTKVLRNRIPEVVQEDWGVDEERNFHQATMVKPMNGLEGLDVFSALQKPRKVVEKEHDIKRGTDDLKDAFQRRSIFALESMATIMRNQEVRTYIEDDKERLRVQWKFISRVFDRFLFIAFFVAAFLFNVLILTSSPFGELFEYCPNGTGQCEGMTREEIMALASEIVLEAAKGHSTQY